MNTKVISRYLSLTVFCGLLLALQANRADAQANPQAISKNGSCPTRYTPSGGYCVPQTGATHAIEKLGNCPNGYRPSGNYCIANSADTDLAIIKTGYCPTGYRPTGNYCLKNK